MDTTRRKSVYLGKRLKAFFARGSVRADSDSARLDRMAWRYAFLVQDSFPRKMQLHPAELVYLAGVVREWTVDDPADMALLGVKVQQISETQGHAGGVDLGSIAYRLKQCKPAELVALVDLCEQLLATGEQPTREAAQDLLDAKGLRS